MFIGNMLLVSLMVCNYLSLAQNATSFKGEKVGTAKRDLESAHVIEVEYK